MACVKPAIVNPNRQRVIIAFIIQTLVEYMKNVIDEVGVDPLFIYFYESLQVEILVFSLQNLKS